MNSIRNFFGQPQGNPFGNMMDMMQKFQAFARDPIGYIMGMKNVNVPQNFHGTPEELARHLINSGQMSQEQFRQFAQTANQMQNMFH